MKLKGELDSIGLAELFKTLADQRATGVLTLSNPNGQKIIALADGEIAIISDRSVERSRLGDLLIARGRLTDQQLSEALRIQRTNEPRTRLGDLLVKHGMIRPQDIADSLKFQMEEEIYDLFTWKNAEFDFDGERSVDEVVADSSYDNNVQRVSLNPIQLIAEATRRLEEWRAIEARLPSPYLCFKLTPKGEELASKGTQATQQILKLLKEGRTIETTVKKSCLGRFNVCKALVKLLDDGWIFPYPASELRMLAAEHRTNNRFSDALHIYRRIMEGLPTESEREELDELIAETIDSIRRAQEAGESVEGAETVSYKEAAERYKRRQSLKRLVAMLVLGLGSIYGAYYFSKRLIPPPTIAEDYRKALDSAMEAEKQKRFTKAISIWQEFLTKLPDPSSPTGKLVQEQIDSLPLRHEEYLETLLSPLERMVELRTQLEAAETGLNRLYDQYKESPLAPRMTAALAKIKAIRDEEDQAARRKRILAQLDEAIKDVENRKYQQARPILQTVLEIAPDGPEKVKAQAAFKTLQDIEARSKAQLELAEKTFAEKKAVASLPIFEKAASEWPELASSQSARKRIQEIKVRQGQLLQDISRARTSASSGGTLEALALFRQIQEKYADFEETRLLHDEISALDSNLNVADQALAQARQAYGNDKNRGRQLYKEVLRKFGPILTQRQIKVPVNIITFPPGAQVRINGASAGATPLDVELPCGAPVQFEFSMEGYENESNNLTKLSPDDMDMQVRMKRKPIADIPLKPGLRSAPRMIGGKLFALHGTSLTVMDPPTGSPTHFTRDNLFDDTAKNKPNAYGQGHVGFVDENAWWWPHAPVEAIDNNRLLLALRTREVLQIDVAKGAVSALTKIPGEPVGRIFIEPVSILNGKTLFAIGTADGKVRAYELEKPLNHKWEKAVDSNPPPKGTLITGLARRGQGIFMALSANGRLASYNVVTGEEVQSLDLKTALAPGNSLPDRPDENTAALVHLDGKITAVDLLKFQVLWDLGFNRGLDEAAYAVSGYNSVFLINRDGQVKRYGRERLNGKPNLLWTRPTGGPAVIPLHLGKYLYAAVNTGTIYAINPEDGREMWNYRTDSKPVELYESGGYLFIATADGRLIVMRID